MRRVLAVMLLSGSVVHAQVTSQPEVRVLPKRPVAAPAAPAPQPAPPVENLQTIQPQSVKLGWSNRHWQLTHNGQVLKDFGTREQDARQALRLIQELRLNQYGTVGSPAVMEYWLVDGAAPQSQIHLGLRPLPFDGGHLRVEQTQGRWCVRDRQRVLFDFPRQEEASQALGVIQKYHFEQVGVIGQTSPMHVFLAKANGAADTGRQEGTHFSRVAKESDGTPKKQQPAAPSPLAGMPQGGLPPVARPTAPAPATPTQPTLTSRQAPLWRGQPHFGPATQPSLAAQPDRVPFDWRQVQLKQEGADWKLVVGSQTLANFGTNTYEAKLALSAVRHYRFNEERRVGGDQSVINYCTAPAMAPRGVMLGLNAQVLTPDKMEVQQVGTGFALCNGQQVVLALGERKEEATRLLEAIKTNKYDRLCQLGEPGKSGLALLVRSH
jgi:hypothetical protein